RAPRSLRLADVRVAERTPRRHPVAHELLQLLRLGKAPCFRARPHELALEPNLEHATRPRNERHLPELPFEGGEQLLREPARTQQPAALPAIHDFDPWRCHPLTILPPRPSPEKAVARARVCRFRLLPAGHAHRFGVPSTAIAAIRGRINRPFDGKWRRKSGSSAPFAAISAADRGNNATKGGKLSPNERLIRPLWRQLPP